MERKFVGNQLHAGVTAVYADVLIATNTKKGKWPFENLNRKKPSQNLHVIEISK